MSPTHPCETFAHGRSLPSSSSTEPRTRTPSAKWSAASPSRSRGSIYRIVGRYAPLPVRRELHAKIAISVTACIAVQSLEQMSRTGRGEQGGCGEQEYRLTTSGWGTVKSGKCIIARATALELENLIHQPTRSAGRREDETNKQQWEGKWESTDDERRRREGEVDGRPMMECAITALVVSGTRVDDEVPPFSSNRHACTALLSEARIHPTPHPQCPSPRAAAAASLLVLIRIPITHRRPVPRPPTTPPPRKRAPSTRHRSSQAEESRMPSDSDQSLLAFLLQY
ncbi:hypothetical protein B0H14DRAFT_3876794 [Mycena olivaceomarginata]|nr:hypothetical protein B0H14DRAFT_3876794 [Mycena olivaceomarginata]